MHTAKEIADWILSRVNRDAGDTISPLKLQKLLYYCQAWHYTIFDKPLFKEKIEAWVHGPVEPSQFQRFRTIPAYSGINLVEADILQVSLPGKTEELLNEVMSIYGEHTASYLENLTHSEDPWKKTRGNLAPQATSNKEIPLALMKEYYSSINK